jgi:dihydroorotase
MKKLIVNALIVNEGRSFRGAVLIDDDKINAIYESSEMAGDFPSSDNRWGYFKEVDGVYKQCEHQPSMKILDAGGRWLLPGVIDDQVHFREPGLTHKGDIRSESRAAVAGGVTTFMDMPNTIPQTTTLEALEWKFRRAATVSAANYSFFFGGTNTNAHLISQLDRRRVPGIKLFLGASTGNMLVDDEEALRRFFGETGMLVAVHAEKEDVIRVNRERYLAEYGESLGISFHPLIRSAEACYASSSEAVRLAKELGTRLHLFHLSTARELSLLDQGPLNERKITGEVCVHHLWFCDDDYAKYGNRIKWNPSIKTKTDRDALRKAVENDTIAVVATDHAPHLLSEKEGDCLTAASGGPLVQHSLLAMLALSSEGVFTKEKVVEKMAHHPAELYRINRRGFIREGYYADLVLIDPQQPTTVTKENLFYKCGWSPFEGVTFPHTIWKTFVNGKEIYSEGKIVDEPSGMEVNFV